ncbi:M20/M25/M40 family metallo-hydrolase [soil metagenome]
MQVARLLDLPAVAALRRRTAADETTTLRDQRELAGIPAPPFGEAERAGEMLRRFTASGLDEVRLDAAGNALGLLPGAGTAPLVLAAHLDTVFPAGTPLEPTERDGRWYAPGIADNARGLAGLLALARLLAGAELRLRHPVLFAATVGEEGTGDLRGAKHLFGKGGRGENAAACVALDGCGTRRVVHRAVGSRRLRVEIHGPGGHSWSDRGRANPLHALARGIAALAEEEGDGPPSSYAAATRAAAGTSVNALPDHAWTELDLRSESPERLGELESAARRNFHRAVARQNRERRSGDPLESRFYVIGDRPAGETPADSPLVLAALAVTRAVGEEPKLAASSTDANVPMAAGIPAIAIGVGGSSGGVHTTGEWFDQEGGARGVERALLIALAAAGVKSGGR